MSTEIRFLLAIILMVGVLVLTNLAFPPIPQEEQAGPMVGDSLVAAQTTDPASLPGLGDSAVQAPAEGVDALVLPGGDAGVQGSPAPQETDVDPFGGRLTQAEASGEMGAVSPGGSGASAETILVESPLYAFTFSSVGARLVSARLLNFPSFTFEGSVEMVRPESGGALGTQILVGNDTLDLRRLNFEVEPQSGLQMAEGEGPQTLRFTYRHPTHPFTYQVTYTFHPDIYVVDVRGHVEGVDAELVFTDLGSGIPFNEQRERDELRASAYVVNHLQQGIRAERLSQVEGVRIEEGPFFWAAFKSKYFLFAILAGADESEEAYLGGAIARAVPGADQQAEVSVSQTVSAGGDYAFRLFLGPQEFARLANLGTEMQNVNPYGYRFLAPVTRPIVGIIMAVLTFLHQNLSIGYGWVLILFGVLMRVVLFPLNQKAMKSQMKNMAVQPLLQEIQAKYKDQPEKLQKEMMKLYKEHGFNPLGGCLPMLIPFPVLIALFFVFQNTIELRGVPFLWLPDLSAPDPLYILPAFLGLSMFLLQWVSMKSMPQQNPQMKMMMYVMPIMMVFIFFNLASGLNLYYATANIATLPQQIYIAKERQKVQAKGPLPSSS